MSAPGAASKDTVYLVYRDAGESYDPVVAVKSSNELAEDWIADKPYGEQHEYTIEARQVDDDLE